MSTFPIYERAFSQHYKQEINPDLKVFLPTFLFIYILSDRKQLKFLHGLKIILILM